MSNSDCMDCAFRDAEIAHLELKNNALQERREFLKKIICELDAGIREAREAAEHALPFVLVQADRWMRDNGGDQFHPTHLDLILAIYKAIRKTPPKPLIEQLARSLDDDALRSVIAEMERLQMEEKEKSL